MLIKLIFLYLFIGVNTFNWPYEDGIYHRYDTTNDIIDKITNIYPNLSRFYTIGYTVKGREIKVLEISNFQHANNLKERRNIRLIGSIFGDEPLGKEILLNFAYHLVTSYNTENKPQLLDNLRIHILPSINIDGGEVFIEDDCVQHRLVGRFNYNGISIEGNFPTIYSNKDTHDKLANETLAVINWMKNESAVFSLTYRANGFLIAYPYETRLQKDSTSERLSPDVDVFKFLAGVYIKSNNMITNSTKCNKNSYKNGIVNGAVWRNGMGGLQDYSYVKMHTMHLNIAITCCNKPNKITIINYWNENKKSLEELVAVTNGGIDGIIKDEENMNPISNAIIVIKGRENASFISSTNGKFSRILLTGLYTIKVSKAGYENTEQEFQLLKEKIIYVGEGKYNIHYEFINIFMSREKFASSTTLITTTSENAIENTTTRTSKSISIPSYASALNSSASFTNYFLFYFMIMLYYLFIILYIENNIIF